MQGHVPNHNSGSHSNRQGGAQEDRLNLSVDITQRQHGQQLLQGSNKNIAGKKHSV